MSPSGATVAVLPRFSSSRSSSGSDSGDSSSFWRASYTRRSAASRAGQLRTNRSIEEESELHEDKTRRIEFGQLPALARRRSGQKRCEAFAFLGFTHSRGWTRDGRFVVKRRTQSQRLTSKLKALRQDAQQRRHAPIA